MIFRIPPRLKKWHLAIKIVPLLIVIFGLKMLFHQYSLEVIALNALFTSLIGGVIFLIGFLINGVISDYKESEKLPGDLACSLEVIHDELSIATKNKKNDVADAFLEFHKNFSSSFITWFYRKEKTKAMLEKLQLMNDHLAKSEGQLQSSAISRIKSEQSNVRKMIIRIDNIRDLSFIQTAYAIVEILAVFVITGLLLMKIEPFYESVFFTLLVSFLVVYMIMLIKDLDNPFDYAEHGEGGTEVSIKPMYDLLKRMGGEEKESKEKKEKK